MAFCTKCGNETKTEVILCPKCNANQVNYKYKIVVLEDEKASWLWLLPGFFIPLLGLILFICKGYNKPKTSMFILIGTVIGVFAIFFGVALIEMLALT